MVKEIERAGVTVVHMCTVTPISMTVGANRIVPTIAIPHRHNPKLQQTHLPQRFRGHMTEFQPEAVPSRPTALP